jgi:peptide/nickel transport system substrate-binding protein
VDLASWGDTKPFNDPNVVTALKYAANRDQIMSLVAPNAYLTGPDIPVPPSDPFYPAGLKAFAYDPDHAKHLVQQAGYRDGLDLTLYAYEGDKLDAALAFKQSAQPAGIHQGRHPAARHLLDAGLVQKPLSATAGPPAPR